MRRNIRQKMSQISSTRRKRIEQARPIREALLVKAGYECLACGASEKRPLRGFPSGYSRVSVHEILCGPLRQKVLDEPCALLVLCWRCNSELFTNRRLWPHARQLALLQDRWPEHYDLERFNFLRNPNAPNYVTQEDVDQYREDQ